MNIAEILRTSDLTRPKLSGLAHETWKFRWFYEPCSSCVDGETPFYNGEDFSVSACFECGGKGYVDRKPSKLTVNRHMGSTN